MMEHLTCLNKQGSIKAAWQAANSPARKGAHGPRLRPPAEAAGSGPEDLGDLPFLEKYPSEGARGIEKGEQSRIITGLSPSMANYSKLLFMLSLDRTLP